MRSSSTNKIMNKEIDLINKRLIFDFIRQNKFQIYSYIFLTIFSYPLNSILISNLFSELIESFNSENKNIFADIPFAAKGYFNSPIGIMTKLIGLLIGTGVVSQFIHEIEKKLFPQYVSYLNKTMRIGTLQSRLENFEEVNIGEMIMRINDVVYDLESLMKETVNKILPFVLKTLLLNIFYSYYNIQFALLNVGIDIIRLYMYLKFTSLYKISAYQKFDSFFENSRVFSSTFENVFHIVINNETDVEIEKQSTLTDNLKYAVRKQMDEKRIFLRTITIYSVFAFLVKFYVIFDLLKRRKLSKKVFIVFLFIEFGSMNEWKDVSLTYLNMLNTYEGIKNGSRDLYKILIENNNCEQVYLPITNGEIQLKNVQFCYDYVKKKCIFNDANYTFSSGGKYILQGSSGSGKSSLINLILKLTPVSSGELTIGGYDIELIPTEQIRQIVTMIPQRNSLFVGLTMQENILYGTNSTKEEIITLLDQYPVMKSILLKNDTFSDFFDRKYDGSNASGGQKRIIINLRGVLRSKKYNSLIVILDEPLVGLNMEAVKDTINMIQKEFENKTVLLVEHLLKQNPDYLKLLNTSTQKFKEVNMEDIY